MEYRVSYTHEDDQSEYPTRYFQTTTKDTKLPRWAVDVQNEEGMDAFWEAEGGHYGSMGSSY
jgi:hypothetical protein